MCRCDGRVVKALDSKSNGVSPRRFESCSQRQHFSPSFNSFYPDLRRIAALYLRPFRCYLTITCDLSFPIQRNTNYILIRSPAQPNIKHLSCNKQPLMGCVNTSRVQPSLLCQLNYKQYIHKQYGVKYKKNKITTV